MDLEGLPERDRLRMTRLIEAKQVSWKKVYLSIFLRFILRQNNFCLSTAILCQPASQTASSTLHRRLWARVRWAVSFLYLYKYIKFKERMYQKVYNEIFALDKSYRSANGRETDDATFLILMLPIRLFVPFDLFKLSSATLGFKCFILIFSFYHWILY